MERGPDTTHHTGSALQGGRSGTTFTVITTQRPKPPDTQAHPLLGEQEISDPLQNLCWILINHNSAPDCLKC